MAGHSARTFEFCAGVPRTQSGIIAVSQTDTTTARPGDEAKVNGCSGRFFKNERPIFQVNPAFNALISGLSVLVLGMERKRPVDRTQHEKN
jgi:hypothetical protein